MTIRLCRHCRIIKMNYRRAYFMKKLFTVCLSLLILAMASLPCYAVTQNEVISQTTTTLANGVECTTTVYLEPSSSRSSTRNGAIDKKYSYNGEEFATVRLIASFTYNGSTATAISASGDHSIASDWSYSGQSVWCSGATAYLTATISGPVTFPVSLSLTCSPTGVLS